MTTISRRALVAGGLTVGATFGAGAKAAPATRTGHRLIAGTRTLEVNGRAAKVFGLADEAGRPGLILAPGERFQVELANQTADHTIIHWHGQTPPWTQDGFPWPQTPPLAPASTRSYDYAPIPGSYWMHSHHGLQEQSLMTAPLIVREASELREDRQEIVLMLHDFSFERPEALLADLTGQTPSVVHAMARTSENVSAPSSEGMAGKNANSIAGMTNDMTGMGGMMSMETMSKDMGSMGSMGSMGGMAMDLNDIEYDAFLANDRTLRDPEIVQVERSGRIRLRIINGASSSQFWVDLGALSGRVVAVDGHQVDPVAGRRFPLASAQRLDILIDLPSAGAFPIFARLEGSRRRTGIVLATHGASVARIEETGLDTMPPIENSLEMRLTARSPLAARQPDLVHRIILAGSMKPYAWSLNGEYWPHITPLMLEKGQRVEIEMINHSMMAHPMHLHGHAFQVIAVNGRPIRGAVRDTVLVMPMGSVRIAFDADNPGRWPLHCHNLYHMMTGMMTELRYHNIKV
jgi:FtsP/CotA-like multicopper oxidase with cupredoxin domain